MNFAKGGETLTWKFWHDINQAEVTVKPEDAATDSDLFRILDAHSRLKTDALNLNTGSWRAPSEVRVLLLLQVIIQFNAGHRSTYSIQYSMSINNLTDSSCGN